MVQSGAYIALDTKSPDPNEKLFNVKGTTQQIQVAQQLISSKIEVRVFKCMCIYIVIRLLIL